MEKPTQYSGLCMVYEYKKGICWGQHFKDDQGTCLYLMIARIYEVPCASFCARQSVYRISNPRNECVR